MSSQDPEFKDLDPLIQCSSQLADIVPLEIAPADQEQHSQGELALHNGLGSQFEEIGEVQSINIPIPASNSKGTWLAFTEDSCFAFIRAYRLDFEHLHCLCTDFERLSSIRISSDPSSQESSELGQRTDLSNGIGHRPASSDSDVMNATSTLLDLQRSDSTQHQPCTAADRRRAQTNGHSRKNSQSAPFQAYPCAASPQRQRKRGAEALSGMRPHQTNGKVI
jgi:hypothetical protein